MKFYDNIELKNELFKEFAFATHPDAYLISGLRELPTKDLLLILLTPDIREWIESNTWLQAWLVLKEVAPAKLTEYKMMLLNILMKCMKKVPKNLMKQWKCWNIYLSNKILIYISIMTITSIFGCGPSRPKDTNENYFFTEIFPHNKGFVNYPQIHSIFPVNENIIFLLGNDKYVVSNEEEQNAYFFTSIDGGKSFKKQLLGNGYLDKMIATNDGQNICIVKKIYLSKHKFQYQLLHSIDMGIHWNTFDVFSNKRIGFAVFITKEIGIVYISEDPIDYDIQNLYRTTDGGVSWKKLFIENIELYTNFAYFYNKTLLALDLENNNMLELDIESLTYKKNPINLPKHLGIYSRIIIDSSTLNKYLILSDKGDKYGNSYFLYCITDNSIISLPTPTYQVNVYSNFIGALGENDGITKYHYSINRGKSWKTETPKEWFTRGEAGMFGEGYLWIIADAFRYSKGNPLMVRIP